MRIKVHINDEKYQRLEMSRQRLDMLVVLRKMKTRIGINLATVWVDIAEKYLRVWHG